MVINQNIQSHQGQHFLLKTHDEQECIPVGCVQATAVAATRCQYQGCMMSLSVWSHVLSRGVCMMSLPVWSHGPSRVSLSTEDSLSKGESTSKGVSLPPPVNRQTGVKTLPSFAIGKNECYIIVTMDLGSLSKIFHFVISKLLSNWHSYILVW